MENNYNIRPFTISEDMARELYFKGVAIRLIAHILSYGNIYSKDLLIHYDNITKLEFDLLVDRFKEHYAVSSVEYRIEAKG